MGDPWEAFLNAFALERSSCNPDMAEDVLVFFCEVVERGDVPERNVLEYLTGCFRKIINGEKPSDALNLTRTKGQRRLRTLEKMVEGHISLTSAVARCMKAGASRDDAIEQVASERGASTGTVKRAYEAYGHYVKSVLMK